MIAARTVLAAFAFVLGGCVTSTVSETRLPTDSGTPDPRRRAEVHTALAGEYYSRGNYGVALAEAKLAISYVSNYVPAWNMQALVHMELREDALARESFERAVRLEPNNAEVLNNYGWFHCLHGDIQKGLDMLNRAVSDPLYPTPEKSYLSMGLCHRKAGRPAEAELYLRRTVSLRPDMIGALYVLAELTYERGAVKDSVGFIDRYLRVSSPTEEALALGIRIARTSGDKTAEEAYMQQMRRRFPDSPVTRELTGEKKNP